MTVNAIGERMVQVPASSLIVDIRKNVEPMTGIETTIVTVSHNVPGIDRAHLYGWSVGTNPSLAVRLSMAIRAGKIFATSGPVRTDVNGKTYISLPVVKFLIGRKLNADLKRLGF